MNFYDLFRSLPGDGWLKEDEAKLLFESAKKTTGPILEVGCYKGRSTCLLASLGRTVICVDPFENFNTEDMSGEIAHRTFIKEITERDFENVILRSIKIEDWKPEEIGFAYLDGDHTHQGTMNQIKIAFNAGAEAVCIHDYSERGGGKHIKRAVEDSGLTVLERASSMVYCRKLV